MATNMAPRGDVVARSYEQVPDEVYLGFSTASIFAAIGLYMTGHRDNAFLVGILGPAFALTGLMIKILGTSRGLSLTR